MIIESGITIGSNITVGDLPTVPYLPPYLYEFSTFTFTTGNVVGATGANLTQLFANSYNSSNSSNVWLTSTSYFGMSKPGYQYWIVPQTAQYTIEVAGARSGIPTFTSNTTANTKYGRGAVVKATFTLEQGTNVTIAVGQPSANTSQVASYTSPGGGGGTFVVLPGNYPLIIAGGGGGNGNWSSNTATYFAGNGVTTTFGGNSYNGAPGGFNGWGGNSHVNLNGVISVNGYDGGGGAGFYTNGVNGTGGNVRTNTTNGATGGGGQGWFGNLIGGVISSTYPPPATSAGGFGGGGGPGPITGGGGGGYSGGGGGYSSTATAIDMAGGGGSWIAANAVSVATSDGQYNRSSTFNGSSITNLATVNAGPGYVTITKV